MADRSTLSYEEIQAHVQPRVKALLQAFEFAHLSAELQAISKPFGDLAHLHAAALGVAGADTPTGVHLQNGLHALLVAKDAIVRAALDYASPR